MQDGVEVCGAGAEPTDPREVVTVFQSMSKGTWRRSRKEATHAGVRRYVRKTLKVCMCACVWGGCCPSAGRLSNTQIEVENRSQLCIIF